jgi:NADPH:quinone reductase-like Zn-dependent oxidoreductase
VKAAIYRRYGGPDVLAIEDLPEPSTGPGEALVRVAAASVAPGDCKARAGLLRRFFEVSFPKVPGRYGAGTVVSAPAGGAFAPGDPVLFSTGHEESGAAAELVARPAARIVRRPAGLGPIEAAAVVHGAICAYVGLVEQGGVGRGARVLVHGGAGAVGSAAVELGAHLGAHVVATCRSTDEAFVRALGAQETVAFDRDDVARLHGIDVVLDTMGGEVHARSCRVLRRGGRLVYLNAEPFADESAGHGVELRNAKIDDRPEVIEAVLGLVAAGVFQPRVGRVLPLAQIAEAHRLVEAGAVKRGRVVVTP